MAKAKITPDKRRIPSSDGGNSKGVLLKIDNHAPHQHFLSERHWFFGSRYRGNFNFPLKPSHIKVEKTAILDDLSRDRVFARQKFGEGNLLTLSNPFNEIKIRRRQ